LDAGAQSVLSKIIDGYDVVACGSGWGRSPALTALAVSLYRDAKRWVADGKAQIAINYVSNILSATGVDLVGALPEELQRYLDFDVVSATTSRDSQAVRALLKFLGEPRDQQLRAHGNEPPRRSSQR
jgi:ABC-type molybdate transport system substrate-binding protein